MSAEALGQASRQSSCSAPASGCERERPAAQRVVIPPSKRNASLTTSLPALKIESCVRRMEEANATVNPLSLMDSSGVTPRGASRQPSLVCFAPSLSASLFQVCMLVCRAKQWSVAPWYPPYHDKVRSIQETQSSRMKSRREVEHESWSTLMWRAGQGAQQSCGR